MHILNNGRCGQLLRLQEKALDACGAFTIYGLQTGFQMTEDRRTLLEKKTNATKYPLARRKDAQARLVDGQPASGSHDERTSSTNLQLPTAPAIGSGGNKLPLRCCRCSPSRHEPGIQKQNLTYQERSVFSSILVCERPDFFKTRW